MSGSAFAGRPASLLNRRHEFDTHERRPPGPDVAYLYAPDRAMVNEAVVRAGNAVTLFYPPNIRHVGRIRSRRTSGKSSQVMASGHAATLGASCSGPNANHCPPLDRVPLGANQLFREERPPMGVGGDGLPKRWRALEKMDRPSGCRERRPVSASGWSHRPARSGWANPTC